MILADKYFQIVVSTIPFSKMTPVSILKKQAASEEFFYKNEDYILNIPTEIIILIPTFLSHRDGDNFLESICGLLLENSFSLETIKNIAQKILSLSQRNKVCLKTILKNLELGNLDRARQIFQEIENSITTNLDLVDLPEIVLIYNILGEKDKAYQVLQTGEKITSEASNNLEKSSKLKMIAFIYGKFRDLSNAGRVINTIPFSICGDQLHAFKELLLPFIQNEDFKSIKEIVETIPAAKRSYYIRHFSFMFLERQDYAGVVKLLEMGSNHEDKSWILQKIVTKLLILGELNEAEQVSKKIPIKLKQIESFCLVAKEHLLCKNLRSVKRILQEAEGVIEKLQYFSKLRLVVQEIASMYCKIEDFNSVERLVEMLPLEQIYVRINILTELTKVLIQHKDLVRAEVAAKKIPNEESSFTLLIAVAQEHAKYGNITCSSRILRELEEAIKAIFSESISWFSDCDKFVPILGEIAKEYCALGEFNRVEKIIKTIPRPFETLRSHIFLKLVIAFIQREMMEDAELYIDKISDKFLKSIALEKLAKAKRGV